MKATDTLSPAQYEKLVPFDEVLMKLARNRYVNYQTEVDCFPALREVYGEVYMRTNGRPYVHRKTACTRCSSSAMWAKRLGRYYSNYKNKTDGK